MKKYYLIVILLAGSLTTKAQISNKEGTRQIHLDFHTSEHIQGIGEEFDKKQFQEALIAGNVNSINVFAKCHHGWCYYPSKAGAIHPNLKFDLLKAQIEACHEIGVRVQAYFTVGWSVKDATEHPEWVIKDENGNAMSYDGRVIGEINEDDPLPYTWWKLLSPEGGYLDLILAQTKEICENYELDGLWYDIISINDLNFSETSVQDMLANGIDTADRKAINEYHVQKMRKFFEGTREIVKKNLPEASLFYNWTTAMNYQNTLDFNLFEYNTKQDLEDLPTTWGGYDIFPMRSKYFANTGDPIVAMSGKFHTAWGEFGGFKDQKALWFEAASMVAFGAAANFGDQLHPSGRMEMDTYTRIGQAFDYVEKIEDYGVYADHYSSLGIWLGFNKENDEGVVKMLLEKQVNFQVVNTLKDWSQIKTIIIPGKTWLTHIEADRINRFVSNGGKLVLLGDAGLHPGSQKFMVKTGVEFKSKGQYDTDYTLVSSDQINSGLVSSPFLNYSPAFIVNPAANSEVLASIVEPYFSRTLTHFSSHRNTPYDPGKKAHPAIVKTENVVYIAHELGAMYFEFGAQIHRDLFFNALMLVHKPFISAEMPSAGRVNLLHQPEQKRYVFHLLYASPIQRGIARVIEDIIPVYDIQIKAHLPKKIKQVYTVPGKKELNYSINGDELTLTVPKLYGHIGVVFQY